MNTIEELQRLLQLAAEERAVSLQTVETLEGENTQLRKKLEQCKEVLQAKGDSEAAAHKLLSALSADKQA